MKHNKSILALAIASSSLFITQDAIAQIGYTEVGIASFYHDRFVGRKTANGEIFSQDSMTAAHKYIKLGSVVRVTNLLNNNSVILRINDRMPVWNKRSIDLSYTAAAELDYINKGLVRVKIEIIDPEELKSKPRPVPTLDTIEIASAPKALNYPEVDVYLRYPVIQYYTTHYETGRRIR